MMIPADRPPPHKLPKPAQNLPNHQKPIQIHQSPPKTTQIIRNHQKTIQIHQNPSKTSQIIQKNSKNVQNALVFKWGPAASQSADQSASQSASQFANQFAVQKPLIFYMIDII